MKIYDISDADMKIMQINLEGRVFKQHMALVSSTVLKALAFQLYLQQFHLTPWLMEPGDLMPHSQGLSNHSYPELNQPNSSY